MPIRPRFHLPLRWAAALLVFVASVVNAAKSYGPGVTDSEIKIGQTMPYSGPASAYAPIGRAEAAYFKKLNDGGGINGRRINLISLDDGYSPPKTVEQTRRLVEQDEVLLMFQTLGTPTNSAIVKYLNAHKVPHLSLASGANKFNDPFNYPYTTPGNPSYEGEARIYASYILTNLPSAKIGVLYQNDDYGKDYLKGLVTGLGDKAAKMIVAQASYETTDATVDSQILALKSSGADVFVNISTPKFAALAIRKAGEIGWKPTQFLNSVSAVIDQVLKPAGIENSTGVLSGDYLRDPSDPEMAKDPAVRDYLDWARKYLPSEDPTSRNVVYGYNQAMLLAHILKQCGDDLTRENVIRQATHLSRVVLPMMMPGIEINNSPANHFAVRQMQMRRFDGSRWVGFGQVLSSD